MYSVYTLIDPRNTLIHYVGITKNPQSRFQQHLRPDRHNLLKSAWVQGLKENSLFPIMDIVASNLALEDAQTQEARLIEQYHQSGYPLTNLDGIKGRVRRGGMGTPRERVSPFLIQRTPILPLLTLKEVVEILGVSRVKVIKLLKRGELRGYNAGGKGGWRIIPETLQAYQDKK